MNNRLRTYCRTGLPILALAAAVSGALQWSFSPTVARYTLGNSATPTIPNEPPLSLPLYTGVTGNVAMSVPGCEAAVAATEPVNIGGVEVRLEGLHYCRIRGNLDFWIGGRSYVSGGLLVFTWGEQAEHTYTASVRHLGSRCAELLKPDDVPPGELLTHLAGGLHDMASSAPGNIHRLLRDFYEGQRLAECERTRVASDLVRAVVALWVGHWQSRELSPTPSTPVRPAPPAHGFAANAMKLNRILSATGSLPRFSTRRSCETI